MTTEGVLIRAAQRAPYRALGRDLTGFDCWGLVLWVCREMGWPIPPDYKVDPASPKAVIRAMKRSRHDWTETHPQDGAVALVGGETPHHAGIGLAGGVLHQEPQSGVVFTTYSDVLFSGARWYKWQ